MVVKKNFEEYLRSELANGLIDFSIRAQEIDGVITFYIHPDGRDGGTQDYAVRGRTVTPISAWNNPKDHEPDKEGEN